jgi:chorismate lyase / 3-hydroxybenzoate synthase
LQAHDRLEATLTRSNAATEETAGSGGQDVGQRPAQIAVRYYRANQAPPAGDGLLAAVCFGSREQGVAAPLSIDVALAPLNDSACTEAWLASGPVQVGRSGRIRYAHDAHHLFAVLEEREETHGGVRATAASVYSEMRRFQQASPFRHLLRVWNYLDAINEGPGDLERYREFCVGRAHGLTGFAAERFPAATAIGQQQPTGRLQVFWLAGRREGVPIENPRQVSAYRYPRTHGPVSPSFSRGTITPCGAVLISGTASIVGHVSQHHDDPLAQLEETVRNLEALAAHARARPVGKEQQLLKAYIRHTAHAQLIEQRLREIYPNSELIILAADICRRELLVEIEGLR